MSVAALKTLLKKEDPETWSNIRVATKYPNISREYFANKGIQVEAIKLNGSMELAPSLNMCRRIVDLVSTGATLKANGLKEIDQIMKVQYLINYFNDFYTFSGPRSPNPGAWPPPREGWRSLKKS